MRFFVPAVDDPEKAEQAYQSIRRLAADSMGWPILDRRIYELTFEDRAGRVIARVGGPFVMRDSPVEPVIAILESNTYLVCTPGRGVVRDMPYMIGHNEATRVVDFEAD